MKAVQAIGAGALLVACVMAAIAFAAQGEHLRKRRMKSR